jgi:hypothetical protein
MIASISAHTMSPFGELPAQDKHSRHGKASELIMEYALMHEQYEDRSLWRTSSNMFMIIGKT